MLQCQSYLCKVHVKASLFVYMLIRSVVSCDTDVSHVTSGLVGHGNKKSEYFEFCLVTN